MLVQANPKNRRFTRRCPHCKGQVGIIMREPANPKPIRALNGRCLECSYRLAWIVIDGNDSNRRCRMGVTHRKRKVSFRSL